MAAGCASAGAGGAASKRFRDLVRLLEAAHEEITVENQHLASKVRELERLAGASSGAGIVQNVALNGSNGTGSGSPSRDPSPPRGPPAAIRPSFQTGLKATTRPQAPQEVVEFGQDAGNGLGPRAFTNPSPTQSKEVATNWTAQVEANVSPTSSCVSGTAHTRYVRKQPEIPEESSFDLIMEKEDSELNGAPAAASPRAQHRILGLGLAGDLMTGMANMISPISSSTEQHQKVGMKAKSRMGGENGQDVAIFGFATGFNVSPKSSVTSGRSRALSDFPSPVTPMWSSKVSEVAKAHERHVRRVETFTREKVSPQKSVKVPRAGSVASLASSCPVEAHSGGSRLETVDLTNVYRRRVHNIISTRMFDSIMGVVIVINSLMVGIESSRRLHSGEDDAIFNMFEYIFLMIYIGELMARIFAHGKICFRSGWVRFDAALVLMGIIGSIVMPIMTSIMGSQSSNVDGALNPVLVLRVFRLFRLARALRLLIQFRTLWMLVQGLIHSSGTILYTVCLICLILYIFSCIGTEIIAIPWRTEESAFGDMVRSHWVGIPQTMLTLVRFVTLDSIGGMYEPMIREHHYLVFFFMPFLLIVSVALMNLVTAVIVEGALEQAKLDKEATNEYKRVQLQSLLPHLREIFNQLDTDKSGSLTLSEVQCAAASVSVELEACLGSRSFEELFELIDEDGSGEVSIDEFCAGIAKLACTDSPIELFFIIKTLHRLQAEVETLMKERPSLTLSEPVPPWQTTDSGPMG